MKKLKYKKKINPSKDKDTSFLKIPNLGSGKDLIVSEILINKDQLIKVDDIVLLIEDDDSAYEIPSPISGFIKQYRCLKKVKKLKLVTQLQKFLIRL